MGILGALGCTGGSIDDRGCTKDTECKGTRICEGGSCIDVPSQDANSDVETARASSEVTSPVIMRPEGVFGRPQGPVVRPEIAWDVDLGSVIFAPATMAADVSGKVMAYVGTHAGRFVAVIAEGPGAGTFHFDIELGGMVWARALHDGAGSLFVGADNDTLYAIDAASGAIRWSKRLGGCQPARGLGPEGARCDVDGGPAMGSEGDLYVGADGVYRIGRDGTIRWHYPEGDVRAAHVFSTPLLIQSARPSGAVGASPPSGIDGALQQGTFSGLVVFGGQDGFVTAVSAQDGSLLWRYRVGADVDGSPSLGPDGTIYVGADDGRVHALRQDGSLKWSFVAQADIRSTVAVGQDGDLYVTSFDGNLYHLEPSGNVRWVLPTAGKIAATAIVDADGTAFVGSQDGVLYAVHGDGKVQWNLQFPDDIDTTAALTSAGTLIVGCDDGHLRGLRSPALTTTVHGG